MAAAQDAHRDHNGKEYCDHNELNEHRDLLLLYASGNKKTALSKQARPVRPFVLRLPFGVYETQAVFLLS
jgi:hypothetical protein